MERGGGVKATEKWRDFRSRAKILFSLREKQITDPQCLPQKWCAARCVDLVTKCGEQAGKQGMPFVPVMWSARFKNACRCLDDNQRGNTFPRPVFTSRSFNWWRMNVSWDAFYFDGKLWRVYLIVNISRFIASWI